METGAVQRPNNLYVKAEPFRGRARKRSPKYDIADFNGRRTKSAEGRRSSHCRSASMPEITAQSPGESPLVSRSNPNLAGSASVLNDNAIKGVKGSGDGNLDGTVSSARDASKYYVPVNLSFDCKSDEGGKFVGVELSDNDKLKLSHNDFFYRLAEYGVSDNESLRLEEQDFNRFKNDLSRSDLIIVKRDDVNRELYSSRENKQKLELDDKKDKSLIPEKMINECLSIVKEFLPGMEKILPLFGRQDLISPHYLAMLELTGAQFTNSQSRKSDFQQKLTFINDQECSFEVKSSYNKYVVSNGKKKDVKGTYIKVTIGFNKEDSDKWAPGRFRVEYYCGLPQSQWRSGNHNQNVTSVKNSKRYIPLVNSRNKSSYGISKARSVENLNQSKSSSAGSACFFHDQICLTNMDLENEQGKTVLRFNSTVSQFKNQLVNPMQATGFANSSEEESQEPWGRVISKRLSGLEKYDPCGQMFDGLFNNLITENDVTDDGEKDKIRNKCIEIWNGIYKNTKSAYLAHDPLDDLKEVDGHQKDGNGVGMKPGTRYGTAKILQAGADCIIPNRQIREKIMSIQAKMSEMTSFMELEKSVRKNKDDILCIADLKLQIVESIKIYRESKKYSLGDDDYNFNNVNKEVIHAINNDSTGGSKLFTILLRRALQDAGKGFPEELMKKISQLIEGITPGMNGKKRLEALRGLLASEEGTGVYV